MLNSKIASTKARPNTEDGFASGNRSVTMISSRNGSVAESVGSCVAKFPLGCARRAAQLVATKKKIAKPPRRQSAFGKPVSSLGIRQTNEPTATRVRTSTTTTGNKVAVAIARTIATKSTTNTNGQTSCETSVNSKIGISATSSASAGKTWVHGGISILRKRWSAIGVAE